MNVVTRLREYAERSTKYRAKTRHPWRGRNNPGYFFTFEGGEYMKLVRNALLVLYINLFLVILLLVSLLWGLINHMENWIQWLLTVAVVISGILNVIFAVKNVLNTFTFYKNKEYNSLRKCMKVLKLGVIPYFVINFVVYLLLFTLFFAASRGLMIFTPIPLFFLFPIFFTYLTVLSSTSPYGIGFAVILRKGNRLKNRELMIHVLLQLCFVLDVIGTLILLLKYKVEKTN